MSLNQSDSLHLNLMKSLAKSASILAVVLFLVPAIQARTLVQKQDNVTRATPGQIQSPQGASNKVQTVAVVNGKPISRQELASACLTRFGKEVLESMVNKTLIENECTRQNIVITDQEIMEQLQRVAKSVGVEGLSVQQYLNLVAERKNISPQQIKDEIIWTDLALRRLASGNLNVTDEEIQTVIDREYGPKVQVRMIVEKSEQQANVLLQAARKDPAQFGNLAKDYSIDQSTAPYMGLAAVPFSRGSVDENMETTIFALKEGQISEVIKVFDRYYIFQCQRQFPATELNPEQLKLVKERIHGALIKQKLDEKAPAIAQALQSEATIINVLNDPELSKQNPGIAAMVNNQPIAIQTLAVECIARFGVEVLEVEIHRAMLKQELEKSNLTVTEDDLRLEITRTAAKAGQVDANGKVDLNKWLNRVTENDESKIDYYVQDAVWPSSALRKLVETEVQVTEEDMTKGFEANYGRRVRVLQIVTKDQRSCEKVWTMARDNPTLENFQRLAETYSMENSSRFNRGEVPPIARYSGRPNLEAAAFALRPNEISGIVNDGNQWTILYCLGMTNPVVKDIDVVKEELYKELIERKTFAMMTRRLQQMILDSKIDNFLAETSQFSRSEMEAFRQSQKAKAGAATSSR